MGLETATTINQLVETNPLGTDNRSLGDDHIRLIKSTLKNTFTGITGVVTATHTELDKTKDATLFCFPGMIVMWSGAVASIPTGWKLCNGSGTISTGGAVPNLVNRFIYGSATDSGGTVNIGQTGGSSTHNHFINILGTALSLDQMPSHTHTVTGGQFDTPGNGVAGGIGGTNDGYSFTTNSTGGGSPHSHSATSDVQNTIPPYYALAFLIKN